MKKRLVIEIDCEVNDSGFEDAKVLRENVATYLQLLVSRGELELPDDCDQDYALVSDSLTVWASREDYLADVVVSRL